MGIEIDGFDELEQKLENLADLGGEVPMEELFTQEFMHMYTEYGTFEEFIEASQWDIENQQDFEEIPEDDFDVYVNENAEFSTWEEMLHTGSENYVERKLSDL